MAAIVEDKSLRSSRWVFKDRADAYANWYDLTDDEVLRLLAKSDSAKSSAGRKVD